MTDFNTIITEDGFVKGELADGGVVTVSDEDWTEADEDTLEGNWEQATRAVVKDIMDTESLGTDVQSGEAVSVDHGRFVDALIDSSIVEHSDSTEERQRAELLLEHLVREGVYERRGEEIVVLDEFDFSSDEFTKLNWTAFFSYAVEEINSVVKSAENQKETIVEIFNSAGDYTADPIDTGLPTKREVFEDLKRVTGTKIEPAGYDASGFPIPPEGVADDDEWEYKKTWRHLQTIKKFQTGGGEGGPSIDEIEKRLAAEINELKVVATQITGIERELREASIREIANMPEVQEQVQMIQQFASSVLVGEPGEKSPEVTAETIKKQAKEEFGMDLTGGVETTDSATESTGPIEEAQNVAETEPGEAKDIEDTFGEDPQL